MRDDLVVPGEHEENFVLAKDARVVTVPFTPLEQRMAKEKPYLMEGLAKLKEILGEDSFKRLISNVHNINLSGPRIRSEERRVGKECRSRWSPYH